MSRMIATAMLILLASASLVQASQKDRHSKRKYSPQEVVTGSYHHEHLTSTRTKRLLLERQITRTRVRFGQHIKAAAAAHHVSTNLVTAVILAESGGNPQARSSKGADGLMQLRRKKRFTPADNIHEGVNQLASGLRKFGSVPIALAWYNSPANLHKTSDQTVTISEEGSTYAAKVLALERVVTAVTASE